VATDPGVRLSFSSDRTYLSAVRELVRELLVSAAGGAPFSERDLCEILLAVQEACVNAIRHGNAGDATKSVDLGIAITPERVTFRVTDEGPGFDPTVVAPAPDVMREDPGEGGYGLAILQRTMNDLRVDVDEAGATLSFWRPRGDRR
jgi:serine/threonine-protein kinase RsbW